MTVYSRSPKVGNPIDSILKSNDLVIPALFVLSLVSTFLGLTIGLRAQLRGPPVGWGFPLPPVVVYVLLQA